jgi:hypothetical protein
MKNQFTSFENDYRNEVFNQSLDLDADFLSDLEKRLEEPKRKKKGLLFWWIFGVTSFCVVVAYGMTLFSLVKKDSWNQATHQVKKKGAKNAEQSTQNSAQSKECSALSSTCYLNKDSDFSEQNFWTNKKQEHVTLTMNLTNIKAINMDEMTIDTSRLTLSFKRINDLFISLLTMRHLDLMPASHLSQKRKGTLELEIYSGMNFTKSYLYSDFNLVSAYDLMLTQSESLLKTKNVGMNLYTYAGHFQWGIGAFVTCLGEQADFHYVDALTQVNPLNPTVVDTTYVNKTYTDQNKYTFIQVPLSIGYQFQWRKFCLTPRYSASLGTRFKEQIGYYPNRNGIGLASFFVPKFNFQQSLQLEMRTDFKQSYLSFTPYLNFNSVKTPPQIFSYRKYINFGLNVGLGIKIK